MRHRAPNRTSRASWPQGNCRRSTFPRRRRQGRQCSRRRAAMTHESRYASELLSLKLVSARSMGDCGPTAWRNFTHLVRHIEIKSVSRRWYKLHPAGLERSVAEAIAHLANDLSRRIVVKSAESQAVVHEQMS